MSSQGSTLSLGLHAAGLIIFYSGYGLLQERIMKGEYGPEQAHFGSSSLLVLLNRLFAMIVGVVILAYKSWQTPDAPSFRSRLVPRSPLYAYAAVAACNFLSTSCQYEALKHVSFTTQSLAKCAKMVPVLLVGTFVYKKTHKGKQWISAGVVTAGCGIYLFSNPPAPKHPALAGAGAADAVDWFSGMMGAILLIGYLFFDGLTSTTQERVFGKSASSSDPFGPQSPVLDQMLYVNFFAVVISILASAVSSVSGSLAPSVWLLMNSPALVIDVLLLSATAALGLIVLLNTIASFGALTSSTIMTCRQFLSILINAGAFGNFASVGTQGWFGVGLVASGIFIKMDPRYREQKKPLSVRNAEIAANHDLSTTGRKGYSDEKVVFDADDEAKEGLLPRVAVSAEPPSTPISPYPISPVLKFDLADGTDGSPSESRKTRNIRYFKQYGIPVLVPAVLCLLISPFTSGSTDLDLHSLSSISSMLPHFGEAIPVDADPAEDLTSTGIAVPGVDELQAEPQPPVVAAPVEPEPVLPVAEAPVATPDAPARETFSADVFGAVSGLEAVDAVTPEEEANVNGVFAAEAAAEAAVESQIEAEAEAEVESQADDPEGLRKVRMKHVRKMRRASKRSQRVLP